MPRMPNQPMSQRWPLRAGRADQAQRRPPAAGFPAATAARTTRPPGPIAPHHNRAPMVMTMASSPMRSTCSLKPSTACAMKAGACCGSTATASASGLIGHGTLALSTACWLSAPGVCDCSQAPQRHTGGEHREETIAMQQLGRAIGQRDQAQREEIVQAHRFLVFAPQVQHQASDRQAQQRAQRPGRPPWPRPRRPAASASRGRRSRAAPIRPSPSMHERKGGAVVQAALAGERKAQPVAVAGLAAPARQTPAPGRWAPGSPPSSTLRPAAAQEQVGDAGDRQRP